MLRRQHPNEHNCCSVSSADTVGSIRHKSTASNTNPDTAGEYASSCLAVREANEVLHHAIIMCVYIVA